MAKPAKPGPRFRRIPPEERQALLIEAGLACLARGGILAFTIDNICAEAEVSRGLITHHFKSKDGLLAAIYDTMIGRLLAVVEGTASTGDRIGAIIEAVFAEENANRETLRIWLALWGEIANNAALLKSHRRHYARYRAGVEQALQAVAEDRNLTVDISFTARMFISLIDGLWLEWCIDPRQMSAADAKAACYRLLEPVFGKLT